nr:probable zinc transporter protein DDB_G0291141 isoform X2 [Nicotiana tomentosiformis]
MAENNHHHRHHRPHRLSLPPRTTISTTAATPTTTRTPYPLFNNYPPSTPTPTPSKHRIPSYFPTPKSSTKTSSLPFLFLFLFSLRSLYSLLPFLRSSPSSFSLFPFSFLVSLLSFLLTFSFSFFTSKHPFHHKNRHRLFFFSFTKSQYKLLLQKSLLLAIVFLLRFQALRYCGTAAMILAEVSGNIAARFISDGKRLDLFDKNQIRSSKVCGFIAMFIGLLLLSVSWDRIECFPLSSVNVTEMGFSILPRYSCIRIWPMLLPFVCGFLGSYERSFMNMGSLREMGRKQVRLVSLFFTTVMLFVPAVISMFVFEADGDSISISSLGWVLVNTVVFGVLLSENFTDERAVSSKDFQKEYLVTYVCTVVLELFYYPELSLWGLLICGLLLWISIRNLNPVDSNYIELGLEPSDWFTTSVMKPLRHILGERKSRKIALFLLINTAYMVVEFVAGFMSNSLGLISDACHMLFDCAALAIGLYASYISRLPANGQFNYGRGRFEILSGYTNAVFLVLVGALIVLESFERILDPQEVSTNSLLSVSIGGLLVNIVGLIFFHEEHHHAHGGSCSHSHSHAHSHSTGDSLQDHHLHHLHDHDHSHDHNHDHHSHDHSHDHKTPHSHDHSCDHNHGHHHHDDAHQHCHVGSSSSSSIKVHHGSVASLQGPDYSHGQDKGVTEKHKRQHRHIDHNMEGIFLHVLADTMGSVGVVISTLLIKYKGWLVADPACSIFISVLIISSVIPLLRNSAEILLQRVPRAHEHDLKEAVNDVMKIKGLSGIQKLHFWSFTNSDVIGTLHLLVSSESEKLSAKAQVSELLHDAGIKDLTMQVECHPE